MTIAIVGKYTALTDAYKSLIEALIHGGVANNVRVKLDWIEGEAFEGDEALIAERLTGVHGVLVPGALRRARLGGHDPRGPVRPRARRSPISASASACRWR